MEVVLVRWPENQDSLDQAREDGMPRLLLVEPGHPPPVVDGPLEDWIRLPASEADLAARVQGIDRRVRADTVLRPDLDEDGVLRLGEALVPLPPVESRLTAALLDRFRAVVSREVLIRAGWPSGAPSRNALDVHVLRLRRRLAPLGLQIRTVRSRGYLLELPGS